MLYRFALLAFAFTLLPPATRAEDRNRLVNLDGSNHVDAHTGLELFPTTQPAAKGTILIAPGGGYNFLVLDGEGRNPARMLNENGWDAAVLIYTVKAGPKTRELALADAEQALGTVRKHGPELGLHPAKIGVMGFSAGGHLMARLAHTEAATAPLDAVILLYPAYLDQNGKVLEEVAPTKTPAFVYVAADDEFVSGSRAFAVAAKDAGLPCELHIPEHGGHGFGLSPNTPASVREWPELLGKFLAGLR